MFDLRFVIHPGPQNGLTAPYAPLSAVEATDDAADAPEVDSWDLEDYSWTLVERKKTVREEKCGHLHMTMIHRHTGRIRDFPIFCRKWFCPTCSEGVIEPWMIALAGKWADLDAVWVAEVECLDSRDWERVDKRRKRAREGGLLPDFMRFALSDDSAWIFASRDLSDLDGPITFRLVPRDRATGMVRDLLSLRDDHPDFPLPIVVRKPSASTPWKLPAVRPKRPGEYLSLFDGCPEEIKVRKGDSETIVRLRTEVQEEVESILLRDHGVTLSLADGSEIPPDLIDEARQLIATVTARRTAALR